MKPATARFLMRRLVSLYKKQRGMCHYCGRRMQPTYRLDAEARVARGYGPDRCTLDHVVPLSRGGAHNGENVVAACNACNQAKGGQTPEEFRRWIEVNGLPSHRQVSPLRGCIEQGGKTRS